MIHLLSASPPTRPLIPATASSRRKNQNLCVIAGALTSLVLILLATGCSLTKKDTPAAQTSRAQSEKSVKTHVVDLSPAQFLEQQKQQQGIFLDVRTKGEVAKAHIKDASIVDSRDPNFKRKIGVMKKDKPVFVYCASGRRSSRASEELLRQGFTQVYNLDGGIRSWIDAGLPIETSDIQVVEEKGKAMTPQAFDQLLAKNTIVFADFHTQWCAPCREMNPVVDALENKYKDHVRIERIDIDQSVSLSRREKASGVPIFVLYEKGVETWRHSGATSQQVLDGRLSDAIASLQPTSP